MESESSEEVEELGQEKEEREVRLWLRKGVGVRKGAEEEGM